MMRLFISFALAMICAPAHAERLDAALALTLAGACAAVAYHNPGEHKAFYTELDWLGLDEGVVPSPSQRESAQAAACRAPGRWDAGIGILYDQHLAKRFSRPFVALQYRAALPAGWDCSLTAGVTDMWNRRQRRPAQPTTIHVGRFYPFFTVDFRWRFP